MTKRPGQYFLLLDLFKKLSNREEFGITSTKVIRYTITGYVALMMATLNLSFVVQERPPLDWFLETNLLVTGLLLLLTLMTEAINTFLNPVDAVMLAHQPILERTYFAAKLTYLLEVVATIVIPLGIVPAFAGLALPETRWFFPLTYLLAVSLLGIFVALALCALIGLLFRVVPLSRLKGIAGLMQAALFATLLFPGVAHTSLRFRLDWFISLASFAQRSASTGMSWSEVIALSLALAFIAIGLRSLSGGYLTTVQLLMRSERTNHRSNRKWLGSTIRWLTGRPSGRAAFSFIHSMARTDWQFRSSVLPIAVLFVALPLIGIIRGLGPTPFGSGRQGPVNLLPHITGLAGFAVCAMLSYSDQHRAAWIYLTAPLAGIRSFVGGIFWALWLPFTAGSMLLFPLLVRNWGIVDAGLFALYSLSLGSLYVSAGLFLVDGLPFANPPKQSSGFVLSAALIIGTLLAAIVIVTLQGWIIFQTRFATVAASVAFAAAAYFVSRASLLNLETNVLYNLHAIAGGRTAMFQELE